MAKKISLVNSDNGQDELLVADRQDDVTSSESPNNESKKIESIPNVKEARASETTMDVTALMQMLDQNRYAKRTKSNGMDAEGIMRKESEAVLATHSDDGAENATSFEQEKGKPNTRSMAGKKSKRQQKKEKARLGQQLEQQAGIAAPSVEFSTLVAEAAGEAEAEVEMEELELEVAEENSRKASSPLHEKTAPIALSKIGSTAPNLAEDAQEDAMPAEKHEATIEPMEYLTVATLMAVVLAALLAVAYLINDKGEVPPPSTNSRVIQQTGEEDAVGVTSKSETSSEPEESERSSEEVQKDLLEILSQ